MPYKDPAAEKSPSARYYQEHRDAKRAYNSAYYLEHLAEFRARADKWRHAHLAEANAYESKWHQEHKEEGRAWAKAWKQANPIKVRELNARREAMKRAASIGPVDFEAIILRDKMICGICHKKVKRSELHFDHIIPLSKGGAHAEHNIQVAHAFCNLSKHDGRLPSQTRLPIEISGWCNDDV